MSELLGGWKRTAYCGEFNENHIDKNVTVMGWVNACRDIGALVFLTLRDRTGLVQVTFDASKTPADVFEKARAARAEYVVAVQGILCSRSQDMINKNMKTGAYEIMASSLKVLDEAKPSPIDIDDEGKTNEQMRLKYRYLDLRRPVMQQNIMLRHKIAQVTRSYFDEQGFLEIETPILTKSTPEGARDYLVPSRVHPGEFYALPQSPQQFKQLLMLSGYDRYMQIARCFRDEDLRADRQPEFTQIDVEMSFVEQEDVIAVNEGFLQRLFKEIKNIDIKLPLLRLSYQESMDRYGSDKPDIRFGLELTDIGHVVKDCGLQFFADAVAPGKSVRCINVPGGAGVFSRKEIDAYGEYIKTYGAKGLAWVHLKEEGAQGSIAKFLNEDTIQKLKEVTGACLGDTLFIVADDNKVVYASLGALRLELAKKLNLIDSNTYSLLWVTDFPLLEWDEDEKRFFAMHHPFTHPKDEDIDKLETNPASVRAKAYDIILNGSEIGGGSIRIHSASLQERMFKALGFTKEEAWERFGFFMEAFEYGTPPHGGIAYGLDRLVMLLCGANSIREVIPFPKVQTAACLMTNSPGRVDDKQLKELHIKLDLQEE